MRMNYAFCLSLLLSVMLEEHVKKERDVLSVDIVFLYIKGTQVTNIFYLK